VSGTRLSAPGFAALLLVAACGPTETTPEKAAADLTRARPLEELPTNPNVSVTGTRAFQCDGDFPVTAIYGTGPEGEPDVALVIMGQSLRLQQEKAASGVRFQGVPGLQPDQGVVWWEKGDEALLMAFPWDSKDPMRDAKVVRTCRLKG
jgi:membrane-bound inhibitor of C-type lysozyme